MTRHLLKLVWNRKRSNLLIMVEILVSFLVLFPIVLLVAQGWSNYRRPLGFDVRDVWFVKMYSGQPTFAETEEETARRRELLRQLYPAAKESPAAAQASAALIFPFTDSTFSGLRGTNWIYATDTFKDVMGVTMASGRWFQEDDAQLAWRPIVINRHFARDRWGTDSPIGQKISPPDADPEMRVIGVVDDFRVKGDFSSSENIIFVPVNLNSGWAPELPDRLLLKVHPGTTASAEDALLRRLRAIAPSYTFEVKPLEAIRDEYIRMTAAPIIAAALVVGFLLLMVALGLNGVIWQSITRRTAEIGLRRAQGATVGHICVHLLGELVLMTGVSIVVGSAILVQVPVLDLLGSFPAGVYTASMLIATAGIFLLVVLSALYPSWLATRLRPVEALHYE
ncbi:MAG: ABC transporter permease [Acidobacteriota bacterium]